MSKIMKQIHKRIRILENEKMIKQLAEILEGEKIIRTSFIRPLEPLAIENRRNPSSYKETMAALLALRKNR